MNGRVVRSDTTDVFASLRLRPLTDHDECSGRGYLHVKKDTHQRTANKLHCGISGGLAG
jgi:hypothetical protein